MPLCGKAIEALGALQHCVERLVAHTELGPIEIVRAVALGFEVKGYPTCAEVLGLVAEGWENIQTEGMLG